ncbi:hypothetical protein FRC18_011618 [Serendipita sp. 400]|nr:hypothetical protein FRC18_011618 [Serendipita sp. 400]
MKELPGIYHIDLFSIGTYLTIPKALRVSNRIMDTTQPKTEEDHILYLKVAIHEAKRCTPVPTAFCVGCVIVAFPEEDIPGVGSEEFIIGTGYSREIPGNTHAEANALHNARILATLPTAPAALTAEVIEKLLATATVYTTLEPCSVRTSGLAPCTQALLDAKIKKCYIGAAEPPDFVNCEGARLLKEGGVEVYWVPEVAEECLRVARTGQ